eukprot:Trichotokara_eunicae@DN5159_c0_g1_i4.p1
MDRQNNNGAEDDKRSAYLPLATFFPPNEKLHFFHQTKITSQNERLTEYDRMITDFLVAPSINYCFHLLVSAEYSILIILFFYEPTHGQRAVADLEKVSLTTGSLRL